MNHTEHLTRYTANYVDELACSGVQHVVISPGSRSTPLAILCTEHERLKEWVLIDERSAAYFALGIAKVTNRPVVLICTSGTAAANYFPAIVEAYYARVPLVVLTADRPHELRGIGASQTINQLHMYSHFVKDFQEMALPDSSPSMLKYVRNRAARAVREAMQGNPGPVHTNFPFREPLLPDLTIEHLWGDSTASSYNESYAGKKRLEKEQLRKIVDAIANKEKGLIVCGPQTDQTLAEHITELADALNIPILADPLSQLRGGPHSKHHLITTYDAILKSKSQRSILKPDFIIRFGAMPISKSYLFYVQEHEDILQIVVENNEAVREPTNHQSKYIFADSTLFCQDILDLIEKQAHRSSWLASWLKKEEVAKKELQNVQEGSLAEGETVREVLQHLPNQSHLFVANSMPVRDLDTFYFPTEKEITIHANRGASGIDGTMSSALGVAAVSKKRVTLLIGDLSFYHDLNSLLIAKHYDIPITIILINNNGGGIFSFLPQAKQEKHFESLFGTPLDIEFAKAVDMYGGDYTRVKNREELLKCLSRVYEETHFSVLEVQTDRTENVGWHRQLWEKIEQKVTEV